MSGIIGRAGEPGRVDAAWPGGMEAADVAEAALAAAVEDAGELARAAEEEARELEELLLAARPEARAATIDLGAVTAALQRVVRRAPAPGASPAEGRLREVAARYLDLRLEVAAGMARITIG